MKRMIFAAFAALLLPLLSFAQQNITGKVTDEKGDPLESVSVLVKGTNRGTQTDKSGNFTLPVSGNATLAFSFTGYISAEVNTDGKTSVSVTLQSTANNLNNVIVIGYGTQKQKDLTGAVSAISNKDFNQGQLLSAQQSIQGKVTGVNISQNSGKPGGSNTIRIRGGTSLTQSNDPLYVIDGVPISSTAGVGQANINSYSTNIFDMEPTNPLIF